MKTTTKISIMALLKYVNIKFAQPRESNADNRAFLIIGGELINMLKETKQ